jgi:aryl carrier-like protein
VAALRGLEQRGADVRYDSVDVSDAEALGRFWERQARDGRPVRGLIHAASVWQDASGQGLVRPLLQLDAAALRAVFAPKVSGTFLLHRLADAHDLDFFVCFSSGASLLGSAGQGNYAAASAFLDALAHHRRRRGRPGLSINWGAIGEIGFGTSAEGRRVHEFWESHGFLRLTPAHVRSALGELMAGERPQAAVLRTDWERLAHGFPLLRSLPWASGLVREAPAVTDTGDTELLRAFRAAPAAKRRGLLVRHVRDEVARVLTLDPDVIDVRRGLFDMGLDSLMALDLKNRLRASVGLDVPATVVFEHPSIEALAAFLEPQLRARAGEVPRAVAGSDAAEAEVEPAAGLDALARVQELSDQEVHLRLEQVASARSEPR